jgi:hypothetical protein
LPAQTSPKMSPLSHARERCRQRKAPGRRRKQRPLSWRRCPTPSCPPVTPPPPRRRPPPCSGELPDHPRPSPCPRLGFPSPCPFNVEEDRGPSDCLKTNGLDGRIPLRVLWDADRWDPLSASVFFSFSRPDTQMGRPRVPCSAQLGFGPPYFFRNTF